MPPNGSTNLRFFRVNLFLNRMVKSVRVD